MRIAVIGVGGVGGYFGGRLAQTGEDVAFIARGGHLEALRRDGLFVESIKGSFHLQPVNIFSSPQEAGIVDAVLLGVKSWQVPEVAASLQPLLGAESYVVPLENGVEASNQLVDALGEQHVVGGLCKISSYIAAPGRIVHAGIDPYIAFGELDNRPSARTQVLRDTFQRAGVNADIPADIHKAIWEKFVFIASISGLGGVTRVPLGEMRSTPETRRLLLEALREVVLVGRANGIQLDEGTAEKVLANIDNMAPGVTASMQRDIMDGKPSELESQNGAVVRLGQAVRVAVPVHEFIYASLLPQETRARSQMKS
jgi:2-dehydropantoate 2-reductase